MILTLHIPINKGVKMITQTQACAHKTQSDQTTLVTFPFTQMSQQSSTTNTAHN